MLKSKASSLLLFILIGCSIEDNEIEPIEFLLSNPTDKNGFVHINANPNVFQTLHRISGHLYRNGKPMNVIKMGWESETNWIYEGYEIPIVNSSSYSRTDGEVNTMMAVIYDMVGDTIQINYGYYDNWRSEATYGNFKVVVD